ncbi:hypothetical protein BC834DRAFT_973431 [Gloeopeniophorella convolvens]|nr:hypothetical protein BC834DRAFT_973431 [Gloeopeniophorella convolvens]
MALAPGLHEHALVLLYHAIGLVLQSVVYGIFASLFPISTYIMLRQGVQTAARKFLLGMTICMFTLSTTYWALSVTALIQLIKGWFLPADPSRYNLPSYHQLFSALVLVNYVMTDGVVVWRAWAICASESRRLLFVSVFFLGCATGTFQLLPAQLETLHPSDVVSVCVTIAIRIALMSMSSTDHRRPHLDDTINVTQVAASAFSLLTNITATGAIGFKVWRWRIDMRRLGSPGSLYVMKSRAGRVLALLAESGVIYIVSMLIMLVSTFIHLPNGTIGDIYSPVNTQIAGLYPIVVLLLADQEYSLEKTLFISYETAAAAEQTGRISHPETLETLRFNPSFSAAGTGRLTSQRSESGDVSCSSLSTEENSEPGPSDELISKTHS